MRIEKVNIFKYKLPLKKPFNSATHKLSFRSGSIIELISEKDISGLGEISPLPGLSFENFQQSVTQLMGIKKYLKSLDLSESLLNLEGEFEAILGEFSLFPSVRYGVESAILDLFSNFRKTTVPKLLYNDVTNVVHVNGLLDSSDVDSENNLNELLRNGYQTIKIKVGLKPIQSDVKRIRELKSQLPKNVTFRLDANRSWSLSQAIEFGRTINDLKISFIEEPLKNTSEISIFHEKTNIPTALDESLTGNIEDLSHLPKGIVALILKPGLRGGVENTITYARKAVEIGLVPIFSCPFYSGVGLSFILNLAAGFGQNRIAMGLDTSRWFSNDLLKKPVICKNGRIELKHISAQIKDLRTPLLEKIVLD